MSKRNEYRPGYKKTKVGWIPEKWECVQLESLSDFITKGATPTTYGFSWTKAEIGIPFLRSQCVSGNGFNSSGLNFITLEAHKTLQRSEIFPGDVLMTITGNIGRVVIFPNKYDKANINQHIGRIRIRKADTYYIYQVLRLDFYKRYYLTILTGQAYPQISLKQVRETPIPLPPLQEQRKIAEILSAWDRAIEHVGKLIDAKQRLEKGLMQQILTGRMRFPEFGKPIEGKGQLPEGWKTCKLSQLFKRVTRKNDAGVKHVLTASGEHGLVNQRDYFNRSVASKSLDGYYHLKRGEYAYNRSAMRGYPYGAIKRLNNYPEGVLSTLYLCFAPSSQENCSDFFMHYFEAGLFNRQLRGIVQIGARAHGLLNVTIGDFFALKVPVPSVREQKQIASVLDACDREIELLKKKLEKLKEQKQGLMQKLLTGEVRVKSAY